MNKREQYKIFVPESGLVDVGKGYNKKITRSEIHELIQKHAEKLGYKIVDTWRMSKYICLSEDGSIHFTDYESEYRGVCEDCTDIPWQDFLQLTQDVVTSEASDQLTEAVELIRELRQAINANSNYVIHVGMSRGIKRAMDNDKLIEKADEFIKKVGRE